ncbi:VanW family protein [Lutibacter sp. B2]|nr:VanW family protein [Lutibacter sp. B2]
MLIASIIFIFLAIFISFSHVYALEDTTHYLPENSFLDEMNISKMNILEVAETLNERKDEILNRSITLRYNQNSVEKTFNYSSKELGLEIDQEKTISSINKEIQSIDTNEEEKHIEISYILYYEKFLEAIKPLDEIKLSLPKNASYQYLDGELSILPSKKGYTLDKELLIEHLMSACIKNGLVLDIPIKEIAPKITETDLETQGATEKIAEFSTKFSSKNIARCTNIKVATAMIDGTILGPGEIFSYNAVVGKRTAAKGFKVAGVYANGSVSKGLGGGICQTSSTLYNAVLYADLEVIERRNHSLTVSYVPLSRDATISWGAQDFKFKNNTDHYIYIHGHTTENTVTFELLGTKNNKRVELISQKISGQTPEIQTILDSNLTPGKQKIVTNGHTGYTSKLIKKIYEDEKLIDSYVVSTDHYKTTPTIIRVGIKKDTTRGN